MPEPSVSSRPAPRRTGRRRRYGAVAVVTALLLLIGRGLGLLGGAPDPRQGQPGEDDAGVRQQTVAGDGASPAQPGAARSTAEGTTTERPAAPVGEVTTAPPPAAAADVTLVAAKPDAKPDATPDAAPDAAPDAQKDATPAEPATAAGMARDRFASRLSLIEQRLVEHQLGAARSSLEHLRAQPLDDDQRRQLAALAARIDAAAAARGQRLLAQLQRGEVLAAARTAEQLVGAGEAPLAHWLTTASPTLALPADVLPDDWRQALVPGDEPLPAAVPVARNRRVRLEWRDELHTGGVVSSRSDQVTVRIQTASGQSYPTVPTVACEPVDAEAAEAIEMGLAAVHAGEPLLARLWFVRALLVADGALPERGQWLLRLVR